MSHKAHDGEYMGTEMKGPRQPASPLGGNRVDDADNQHPREVPTIRGPKPETESQPHPSDQKPQYTWPEPKKGK